MIRPTVFADRIIPLRGAFGQSAYPTPVLNERFEGIAPTGVDIIDDAPEDGFTYGRRNGEWVRIVPLSGAEMEGRLFLYDDPLEPLEAATKRYVDSRFWTRVDGGVF
jgi:hypothetical protein